MDSHQLTTEDPACGWSGCQQIHFLLFGSSLSRRAATTGCGWHLARTTGKKENKKKPSTLVLPRSQIGPLCTRKQTGFATTSLEEMCVQEGGKAHSMKQAARAGKHQKQIPQPLEGPRGAEHTQDKTHLLSKSLQKLHCRAISGSGHGQTRTHKHAPLQSQTQSLKRLLCQGQSSPVLYHHLPVKKQDWRWCWQTDFTSQEPTPGGTQACLPTHIHAYATAQSVQQKNESC